MSKKLTDPTVYVQVSEAVAAELHEGWRKDHKAAKGDTPRWKPTSDKAWWAIHSASSFARSSGGAIEVDINIPFADLPTDWQAENLAAAQFVVRIVINRLLLAEPLDVEALSSQIHDAWLVRQRLLPVEAGKVPYFRSSGQDVPYAKLSDAEQKKDRDQVEIAERHVADAIA